MRRLISAAAVLLISATAASAADPVGQYTVKGSNPGKDTGYSGTATVTKTGETYRVVWVVGDARYTGTAIGNKDFLAISYKSGDQTGLSLFGADGENWAGVWAYSGGRVVGAEVWERE